MDPSACVPVAQFIDAARSFVGVPFQHQGRNRNGIDCVGLAIAALTKVGVVFFEEPPTYGRLPVGDSLLAPLREYCTPTEATEPGSLLAIRFRREVTHVAILTGPTIIHSYEGARRVVEHGYDKRWQKLTVAQWRLPGVMYV